METDTAVEGVNQINQDELILQQQRQIEREASNIDNLRLVSSLHSF